MTKSGQANKLVKKWRYEEQMGFLEPFSRQRETIGNLDDIDVENEDMERLENTAATETQKSTSVTVAEEDTAVVINSPTEAVSTPTPKRQQLYSNHPPKGKKDESASAVVMKYLIEKQTKEQTNHPATKDPTDMFFESIAAKVKRFTPYYRNIAESRVFSLVQQLELDQILPTNQHQSSAPSQFQQQHFHQHQPTSSNNYNFHNLVPANQSSGCVLQPMTSPATSNSTAASYIASFYDDSNVEDND